MTVNLAKFLDPITKTVLGVVVVSISTAAGANLITNGNFDTGNLNGWTTFTTANGTIGTPSVVPFDTTGSGASLAAQFNVGEVNFANVGAGGGIYQSFMFSGGTVTVSADIASNMASFVNVSGGVFTLLLDGVQIDVFDFGGIAEFTTERSTLDYTGPLAAGEHELRIGMIRAWRTNDTTPRQYIDNVNVSGGSAPEPSTLALLGLGLAGLAASRQHKH
jgi:PEP-CTERM motif